MINTPEVQLLLVKCKDCITYSTIALASTISGVDRKELTFGSFIRGFLIALGFILIAYAIAEYYLLSDISAIALAYILGRYALILDKTISDFIKDPHSFIDLITEIIGVIKLWLKK